MNPEKNINENEQLEQKEYDRNIKIAEQKRFEATFKGFSMNIEPRESIMKDIEIYKQGNLEY